MRQTVEIHAAIIIGHIDLASVNHRRIKLVEQKLDAPPCRLRVAGVVWRNPADLVETLGVCVDHARGEAAPKLKITLEIEAELPSGAPENVVRTVTENCRTLRFDSQGFEEA